MRTIWLCLFFASVTGCCLAQTNQPSLRIVGTNLFDFSNAGEIFKIRGTVTKIYPQSIEVSVVDGTEYRMMDALPYDPNTATAADKTDILEAINVSHYSDGTERHLSFAQYCVMPKRYQIYFEPVPSYRKVYLLHPPAAKIGQTISAVFVPTKTPDFYDCGTPFFGNTNSFHCIYRLRKDTITKEVY